jgi:SAM-dependent methyltransferase
MQPRKTLRPFYGDFAWAFDLLIDRPVQDECRAIATWLAERGVVPGTTVLDAGCGTGRYSIELGRRGYSVCGIDASTALLEQANRSLEDQSIQVSFSAGDILSLPVSRYDAILCRGVLNDVIDQTARESAFSSFSRALREGGVLVLDVRDWDATATRKARNPLFKKSVDTDRGRLTFTSVAALDAQDHQMTLSERHLLEFNGHEHYRDYEFVMRCWTPEELRSLLHLNGFHSVSYFGAYDPTVAQGLTDRLVAVAQLSENAV